MRAAGSAIVINTGKTIDRLEKPPDLRELARRATVLELPPADVGVFAAEDLGVSGQTQQNGTESLVGEQWLCQNVGGEDDLVVDGDIQQDGSAALPGENFRCVENG